MFDASEEDKVQFALYLQALGEAIRSARKKKGEVLATFTIHIGLSQSYYSKIEQGQQNLTLGNLMVILEGLRLAPERFFQSFPPLRRKPREYVVTRQRGLGSPEMPEGATYAQTFGLAVRHERVRAGFTQDDFAFLSGLARPYLSGLEGGKKNPTFIVIMRILEVLELHPGDFFKHLRIREGIHRARRVGPKGKNPEQVGPRNRARLRAHS